MRRKCLAEKRIIRKKSRESMYILKIGGSKKYGMEEDAKKDE